MKEFSKIDNEFNNPFNRGITLQRELYKQSMLEKDYDLAITSIESIKSEIKNRALSKGMRDHINYIEKVINWYRTIPFRFQVKTPEGLQLKLPEQIELKILKLFNKAYEKIIVILNNLKML